jgi:UDP-N-acetylmuramoyl-L-alanyl-D-glutamate--2,6-diaminopimelate ligase
MAVATPETTLDLLLEHAGLIGQVRIVGDPTAVVSGLTHDSRQVRPRSVFCCVPGDHVDGHDFAQQALDRGATVLVVDHVLDVDATQVVVDDVRRQMGPLAVAAYGDPSRRLRVIGVTGTNGKTTTVSLLAGLYAHLGQPSRSLGTLTGVHTTPEAPELQATLADLAAEGVTTVAMEVSSHALALHRVDGMHFAAGVFTNLGRDHLDLHGSPEAYFAAKARLFEPERCALAVINVGDPAGRRLAEQVSIPVEAFDTAELREVEVGATWHRYRWRSRLVRVPLGGRFNVANSLAAATTATALGLPIDDVVEALADAAAVPGRFETIQTRQGFTVVVDYAHTPDGLAAVLEAAREVAAGHRVLLVFGCGGDRDRDKRPLMGAVASSGADLVIVTSDNPRSEDPQAIIDQIVAGVPLDRRGDILVEADREIAMGAALRLARADDVVVLAGKGHETTQTIGNDVYSFDDANVARRLLESLR